MSDWSFDSQLLQSSCGAYELLCWDVSAAKLFSPPAAISDIKWSTLTTVLGFCTMGIWPPDSDGSDINSLDVDADRGLVVTGDDKGLVKLFHFPCVAHHSPFVQGIGHASHVANVRFFSRGMGQKIVASVGGRDGALILWTLTALRASAATAADYGSRDS